MRRPTTSAALLAAALLAACARTPAPTSPGARPPEAPVQAGPVCRLGPDGAMPLADRGIGGTGQLAERGIGGTGIEGGPGTGILGVITGFASVCVGGQEIAYGPAVPVQVDGRAGSLAELRAGQVTAIEAAGRVALRLIVRHEVSGLVEPSPEPGELRVAGQRVRLAEGAWGVVPAPGTWVEVSGFRLADGTISATRLDPRPQGDAFVRGILRREGGYWRIGALEIRPGRDQVAQPGLPVVAAGRLSGGVLLADTIEADGLVIDPALFFGPAVGVLILEGYAEGGRLRFGGRLDLAAPLAQGRAVTRLERNGGEFRPAFTRPSGTTGFAPAPLAARGGSAFTPAPMPNRGAGPGMGRPDGAARGGPRDGGRGDRAGFRGNDPDTRGDFGGGFRGGRGGMGRAAPPPQ